MTRAHRDPYAPLVGDVEVLTPAQAAEVLGVDTQTLRALAGAGDVPSHRLPGHAPTVRFLRAELVAWLSAR